MTAPNFLCAKLVYKILTYQFAGRWGRSSQLSVFSSPCTHWKLKT